MFLLKLCFIVGLSDFFGVLIENRFVVILFKKGAAILKYLFICEIPLVTLVIS